MELIKIAVSVSFGSIIGFCLAAYLYGKELAETVAECERRLAYINELRDRLYNRGVKK